VQGGKIDDITVLVAVVVEEEVPMPLPEKAPERADSEDGQL
jgi:hypothetical protein